MTPYILPLIAVAIGDVLTTNAALKLGGREANPLVNILTGYLPVPVVQWGLKAILVAIAALIDVKEAYIMFAVVQGAAVLWNLNQIRKLKKAGGHGV